MYENFWPKLLAALAARHPEIEAKPNRSTHNYWTFRGPALHPGFQDWVCNFPANPARLRVELFLGSDKQRQGVDVLGQIGEWEKANLQSTFQRPEDLQYECWTTAAGHASQRIAVYRTGSVHDVLRHDEYIEWFIDRLVQLQQAVAAIPLLDAGRTAGQAPPPELPPSPADSAPLQDNEGVARLQAEPLQDVVDALLEEPLFHLSLHSRELFHSNLVAWLCERYPATGQDLFRDVLVPDPDSTTLDVRRECKNLDLILEFPGFLPLVIENKVFALPDEDQLVRYASDNIPKALGAGRASTRVLLSLVDPGWVNNTFGPPGSEWRWLSYRELGDRIAQQSENIVEPYGQSTLLHYSSLLEMLTELVDQILPRDAEELVRLPESKLAILRAARLQGTAKKMRARYLTYLLRESESANGYLRSRASDGFTHGEAILESFTTLPDGDQVGWQLQGDALRICALLHSLAGKGDEAKARRAEHAQTAHSSWFTPGPDVLHPADPAELRPAAGFNHFAPAFVHKWVPTIGLTVGNLLKMANNVTGAAETYADDLNKASRALTHIDDDLGGLWWPAFEDDLTSRLQATLPGFIVSVEAGRYYARAMGEDGDVLHCEVVSNEFLAEEAQLDLDQEAALLASDWSAPGSEGPNWSRRFATAEARTAAAAILQTLRHVYGCSPKHLQPRGPVEGL